MHGITKFIRYDLYLNMSWFLKVSFYINSIVTKSCFCFAFSGRKCRFKFFFIEIPCRHFCSSDAEGSDHEDSAPVIRRFRFKATTKLAIAIVILRLISPADQPV